MRIQILCMIAWETFEGIADQLCISEKTVTPTARAFLKDENEHQRGFDPLCIDHHLV